MLFRSHQFPQGFVSLRRIEKYLNTLEISPAEALSNAEKPIAFQSATVTWPTDRTAGGSGASSAASSVVSTPRRKFILLDLTLQFPPGGLSLICGKLGSGKTLLLLCMSFLFLLLDECLDAYSICCVF